MASGCSKSGFKVYLATPCLLDFSSRIKLVIRWHGWYCGSLWHVWPSFQPWSGHPRAQFSVPALPTLTRVQSRTFRGWHVLLTQPRKYNEGAARHKKNEITFTYVSISRGRPALVNTRSRKARCDQRCSFWSWHLKLTVSYFNVSSTTCSQYNYSSPVE